MITIESLRSYGADVDAGLSRCLGMTDFYLRLVNKELNDRYFSVLTDAFDRGDAKTAFEAAHALKGAAGNLGLSPLYGPLCEMTEKLRGQESMPDTGDLYPAIQKAYKDLKALAE